MEIRSDFRELLAFFNARGVEYVVVGGYALAFHGAPKFTRGLDIYICPSAENAERVLAALRDFGFGSLTITPADLSTPDQVIQLGVAPVRVDLVTSIGGVSWSAAWEGRVAGQYGDVSVWFLGREQFIASKRAAGRLKDLADLEALGEQP